MTTATASPGGKSETPRWATIVLLLICGLYSALAIIGIRWGLPNKSIDRFLFGDGEVWSGEKIHRLAQAGAKLTDERIRTVGADVDVDSLTTRTTGPDHPAPIPLTSTEEDAARIYLRYRLYTYQPDEMITMMALAGMNPGALQFDPRLYQYGGLFIYPVGVLIKLCGMAGLIDVRSDLVFYLDHPEEFGKFYVVARAYSASWGLVGVLVVFALSRRLCRSFRQAAHHCDGLNSWTTGDHGVGLLGATLFALMPVVVCMAHEGKPHLPGAVLMLLSIYFAVRFVEDAGGVADRESAQIRRRAFWLMCLCCGAAVGMVLSSAPILVLIPLAILVAGHRSKGEPSHALRNVSLGGCAALGVYVLTNPYVVINLVSNRDVLRSNFGNSLAMYEISRAGEGLVRVLELTREGATLPIVLFGVIALVSGLIGPARRRGSFWLLFVPALVFFAQFVLLGAGKPAEFGRFGVFTNTALAIGTALLFGWRRAGGLVGTLFLCIVLLGTAFGAELYVRAFIADSRSDTSRNQASAKLQGLATSETSVYVPVEPAPYCCPPMNFAKTQLFLSPESELPKIKSPYLLLYIDDRLQRASISWANKRIDVRTEPPLSWAPPIEEDSY